MAVRFMLSNHNDVSLLIRKKKPESRAMGQPITLAKRMILGPAATWRYYAGYAGKVAGESYPPDEDGTYKIVQYEPLGKSILSNLWLMNSTKTESMLTMSICA